MMKYLTYCFMTIASTFLVVLLSLSSCNPAPQATIHPSAIEPLPSLQSANHQAQAPSQTSSQPANATVQIHNFKFEPTNVTIAEGETIQFINADEEPHTATSTDGIFNSKALDTDETWNYTATQLGTFPYICSIHPFMKGMLTVIPKKT